ncbi:NAD(P)-binding protein [Biscogniauxia marginata]|nr:NAD(P)-binding protein [Biscogniauxia marginata]
MSKQTVLLIGATGETGSSILDGLIEDGSFDITCLVRTASAGKPAVQGLKDRGLKVATGDLTGPHDTLAALLQGIDTVISAIFAPEVGDQVPLVDAAVEAGVRRFVPCNWGTPCARGGILDIRDLKEAAHDHVFRRRLGYTIVDVGYWYQTSFPRVPSGRLDYAAFLPANEVVAGGAAPNMLIDLRDVGRVAARIVKDPRTLNKRVYAYGEVLVKKDIIRLFEEKTGEKLELTHISAEDAQERVSAIKRAREADPSNVRLMYAHVGAQYAHSMHVRGDNTPENAEYLGYISARELYPDLEYTWFADFADELVAGTARRVYPHMSHF